MLKKQVWLWGSETYRNMESQLPQPGYDDTKSPEATATSESAPLAKLPAAERSVQTGEWLKQISEFLTQLPDYLGGFFNEYKRLIISTGIILAAVVALRVFLAIVGALNDIPLLAPTFKLVGIGYSVWFINRYLLKPSNRQELFQEIQRFLNKQENDVVKTIEGEE